MDKTYEDFVEPHRPVLMAVGGSSALGTKFLPLLAEKYEVHALSSSEHALKEQVDVNILGSTNLTQAFIKYCRGRNKKGCFIYISSILSERPAAGAGIYGACKAYNDNLMNVAMLENARRGMRFNSIRLGYMGDGLCASIPEPIKEKLLKEVIPAGHFGTPQDIASAVDFLARTEYVNGTSIKVAGGM